MSPRIIIALAAVTTLTSACFSVIGSGDAMSETRSLEAADGFVNTTFIDVVVTEATGDDVSEVTITCDDNIVPKLLTTIEGGTLVLETEKGANLSTRLDCLAEVTLPALRLLESHGSGHVEVDGDLTELALVVTTGSGDIDIPGHIDGAAQFELSGSGNVTIASARGCNINALLSGSGDFSMGDVEACDIDVDVSGSGNAALAGKTDSAEARLSGSGSLDAMGLTTADAVIRLDGSGDAEISATSSVAVEVNGSGDVTIGGGPEQRDVVKNGSGSVEFE